MKCREIALSLFMLLVANVPPSAVQASPTTLLYIDPVKSVTSVGWNSTIHISIANVTNLYGYEFKLYYNTTLLDCVDLALAQDHLLRPTDPAKVFIVKHEIRDVYNATHGRVWLAATLLHPEPPKSGSGRLATVTFKATTQGRSPLNLKDAMLSDMNAQLIPHNTANGSVVVTNVTLRVEPLLSPVRGLGDMLNINVTISNVLNLYGYDFKLGYNTTMLDALNVTIQPFLNEPTFTAKSNISESEGAIWVAVTSLAPAPPANGNGTLVSITFNVTYISLYSERVECMLDLYDTDLADSNAQPIEHAAADGYYTLKPGDVAVYNVRPSKTIVGQGLSIHINVTAVNEGVYTEVFKVTAYYNAINPIATQPITLAGASSTTVSLAWNTADVVKGNYTISAYATPVPGETDTEDNSLTDGWVIVAMVGDVTGHDGRPDGRCDIRDLAAIAGRFVLIKGDPRYDANYDLNYDGKIDIRDIALAALHFGEIDP